MLYILLQEIYFIGDGEWGFWNGVSGEEQGMSIRNNLIQIFKWNWKSIL